MDGVMDEEIFHVGVGSLPEDIILHIFQHLNVRDLLLGVQYVCRSWRRICRDPILWRRRRLAFLGVSDWPVVIRALYAAPALASLHLEYDVLESCPPALGAALRETRCRVQALTLHGECAQAGTLSDLMQFLETQQPHLRELNVQLEGGAWESERAGDRLFQTLAHMEDLRDLRLQVRLTGSSSSSAVASNFRVPQRRGRHSTLTDLFISADTLKLGRGVNSLITAHAPTLLNVSLPECAQGATVGLLGKCSNLVSANVPAVSEVFLLRDCPHLSELQVVGFSMGRAGRKILNFIRESSSLEELSFLELYDGLAELIEAVAYSKSASTLRRLYVNRSPDCVDDPDEDVAWDVGSLSGLLLRLPALEGLGGGMGSLTIPLVEAISPVSAPSLRILKAGGMCSYHGEECFLPALRRLLQRYPSLHVDDFDGEAYADDESTAMCWPEHSSAGALAIRSALFGHDADLPCEVCDSLREEGTTLVQLR